MSMPLRPSGVTVVNQSKRGTWARAEVECGTVLKIQKFTQFLPLRLPLFIYLNLLIKPGPCSQET